MDGQTNGTLDTLKALTRDLVQAVGGLKRAAHVAGAQMSHLSEAGNRHHPDRWLRLDQLARLEADAQEPIVTAFLADLHGMDLAPRAGTLAPASPHQHMARLSREYGEAMCAISQAIEDGHLTAAERAEMVKALDAVVSGCHAMIADLQLRVRAVP